uniref:Uncharacterized protein n=2 Tax=unclassified Caudoviricetes TaxID=2788787 RepID=A0A8S5N9R9_9CAUD|nr:MAG TPA: hypothetical protein [Siphoviridae sp. ctkBO7]DAD91143.1 MAG TPA: hypothetical protein [Siphoviridae sp. ctuaf34]
MSCEDCPNRDYCIPDECMEEQKKTALSGN